jgi:hypothetical protein
MPTRGYGKLEGRNFVIWNVVNCITGLVEILQENFIFESGNIKTQIRVEKSMAS